MLVDAARQHGVDGLVLVGFGGGSYPTAFLKAGKRAVQIGIPVVLATRSAAGRGIIARVTQRSFSYTDIKTFPLQGIAMMED